MNSIFNSSLGKKLIMSISGVFLMLFLLVHLTTNLLLLVPDDGKLYNMAAHTLATTPLLKVVEYLLAFGFIFHIVYAIILTLKNRRARPIAYAKTGTNELTTWSSKNMFVLGTIVFIVLVIHLVNFFIKLRFGVVETVTYNGVEMHNSYSLVSQFFVNYWWYSILYIAWAIFLGFHLSHGFWSAFQTIGLNNSIWIKRLQVISTIYAVIVAVGFTIIPLYFWILG